MPRRRLSESERRAKLIASGGVKNDGPPDIKADVNRSLEIKPGDFIELTIIDPTSGSILGIKKYFLCPENKAPPENSTEYIALHPKDYAYKTLLGRAITDHSPYQFQDKLTEIVISRILDHPETALPRQATLPK